MRLTIGTPDGIIGTLTLDAGGLHTEGDEATLTRVLVGLRQPQMDDATYLRIVAQRLNSPYLWAHLEGGGDEPAKA